MSKELILENKAIRLTFEDDGLKAENRISGKSHVFDFPAFKIMLGDAEISSDLFESDGQESSASEATFRFLHRATGIEEIC